MKDNLWVIQNNIDKIYSSLEENNKTMFDINNVNPELLKIYKNNLLISTENIIKNQSYVSVVNFVNNTMQTFINRYFYEYKDKLSKLKDIDNYIYNISFDDFFIDYNRISSYISNNLNGYLIYMSNSNITSDLSSDDYSSIVSDLLSNVVNIVINDLFSQINISLNQRFNSRHMELISFINEWNLLSIENDYGNSTRYEYVNDILTKVKDKCNELLVNVIMDNSFILLNELYLLFGSLSIYIDKFIYLNKAIDSKISI